MPIRWCAVCSKNGTFGTGAVGVGRRLGFCLVVNLCCGTVVLCHCLVGAAVNAYTVCINPEDPNEVAAGSNSGEVIDIMLWILFEPISAVQLFEEERYLFGAGEPSITKPVLRVTYSTVVFFCV